MNQLCRVCGEPAAGFHFGAFTCEGCKSFFGRSYNNLGSISECKNNGECVINKKNRTACKACRLRKCLLVGMSKSGSRYGRRSNWFKIHCLLQQQQQQAGVGLATSTAGLLRPHPYYRHLNVSNPATTDAKSSESDSGASSADPDDEMRSTSAFSYFGPTISPTNDRTSISSNKILPHGDNVQKLFPGKVPSLPTFPPTISPSGLFPRWLPTFPNISYPAGWRDLWLRGPVPVAEPAPEQDQPIDLSLRPKTSTPTVQTDSESELNIDVGVEESIKHVPIDLSLDNSDKSGDIMN
ncbi:hypothetical protein FQR65_LT07250 [Abscondita terminalis]|nr:hypothetical protein FQR65_LT07250 [Abscondita terminalis]